MKIDVTKIEGYAEMTPEEKLAALESYEFAEEKTDDSEEVRKLKESLSKSNSEAASWKKQFREKQTEAERTESERKEREQKLEEELATFRKEKTIAEYNAQCLKAGYDSELASATAKAMADGDFGTVFSNLETFIDNRTKQIQAEALKSQPSLSSGKAPSKDDIPDKDILAFRKGAGLD